MLVSANDGANALAYHCSGTVENFMEGLNAHLQAVGCKNTTFYNPHGLYYPNHKTTAYDLAVMTKEALKHPLFREIVASDKFTKGETNLQPAITFTQSNRLIRPGAYYYPKAIGVKTGYIRAAGHNLVAAATHEGRTLIAVVMKCSDRKHIFEETKKMFEAAFKETPVEKVVLDGGLQSFQLTANGAEKPVKAMLEDKLTYTCYPSEEPEVKCTVIWDEVKLPVSEGDRIGQVRLKTNEGRLLAQAPLYAYEDVSATFSHRSITSLTDLWSRFPALSIVVLSVILGVIILLIRRSLI
jgi:D-alanyl-D-alanine carboxypeptidase (penicillin-binding protein 5/6)